ncbi:MAG: hypothetical protein KIT72_19055 [Polyangiaceae bacterium]|nr:hypothetical protein [Polyangiaceae bacterium]MCW5792520.1 hypothetical protein [Polyangiaceae bacterium]
MALTLGLVLFGAGCSADGGSSGGQGARGSGANGGSGGDGGTSGGGSGASSGSGGSGTARGDIGDPCTDDSDCALVPGAECWTTIGGGPVPTITFPGGFCSRGCSTDSQEKECGENGSCTSTSMSGGGSTVNLTMCRPPCRASEDCRESEGYRCQIVIANFGVCVPP